MRRGKLLVLALAASLTLVGTTAGAAGAQRPQVVAPSDAERLREAEAVYRRAELLARRISRRLNAARLAGDAARERCVDDKLSRVHSTLRMVTRRLERLREAMTAGETRARDHQLAVLGVLDARLATLDRAARACEGEVAPADGSANGITRVEVWVAPDVPREDPTRLPRRWGWRP